MASRDAQDKPDTALSRALRDARAAFVVVGVFSFFLNLLYLVSPLYMLQVYDRVLASGSRETLFYLTVMAVGALVVFGALEGLRTATLARAGAWLNRRLASPILHASLRSNLARGAGGAEPLRDLQQVQGFVGGPSVNPFFDAPWSPIFIILIWMLHPWLGVLALATGVVLFAIALANEFLTRKPLEEGAGASAAAMGEAQRIVAHSETVRAMGMLPALEQRWSGRNAAAQARQLTATEASGWLTGLSRFVRLSAQIGVLGIGALMVLRGEMSAGAMIAGSILLGRAVAPVEQSINAWRGFVGARMSHGRLRTLLTDHGAEPERTALPAPRGKLSVEHVYVRAPGSDRFILRDVSFKLAPGEAMAIVGPSAAGKSTLCRTLCSVMPVFRGTVRLDGADLNHWPERQLGAAIGYLPQTVELFDGTVRENIARMQETSAEAVTEAASMAGVHDMVLQMPEGYETPVGPNGINLSGGQRQRIGLARAVFGTPKLVILDEPNANLDQAGEAALSQTIAALKAAGSGVVMVAHRQSALAAVDKILVLNNGAVDMFDSAETVLRIMAERRRFTAKSKGAPPTQTPANPGQSS
ncbi:MAG: type I secretion system permease/ATPase [Pseudomonadota bacterium]